MTEQFLKLVKDDFGTCICPICKDMIMDSRLQNITVEKGRCNHLIPCEECACEYPEDCPEWGFKND